MTEENQEPTGTQRFDVKDREIKLSMNQAVALDAAMTLMLSVLGDDSEEQTAFKANQTLSLIQYVGAEAVSEIAAEVHMLAVMFAQEFAEQFMQPGENRDDPAVRKRANIQIATAMNDRVIANGKIAGEFLASRGMPVTADAEKIEQWKKDLLERLSRD